MARAEDARQIRIDAANFQHGIPLPAHPDNGDEDDLQRYPQRSASYSKGLPHDSLGDVNTTEYNDLLAGLASSNPSALQAVALGGTRKLVNPQAAYAFQLEGADSHALTIRPAPTFDSVETANEMEELYWMFLARDVAFQQYTSGSPPSIIADAIQRLNALRDFRGPKSGGQVTAATLFRDSLSADLPGRTPDVLPGPFVSQFLLKDVPYGAQTISQRIRTRPSGDDRLFAFAEWLAVQRGQQPSQPESFDPTPRYIRNGRDLAELVHHDPPLQTTLNAALIIAAQGDIDLDPKSSPLVHDPNNPYLTTPYQNQEPFVTFGNADGLDLALHVLNLALRAQWYQKWLVHRRLRPEEFGGRVHVHRNNLRTYPIHMDLLESPVLARVLARNDTLDGGSGSGTYLLSQAFPEGCPLHPAYGSGHSTYIGAGVTMLKAFYKTNVAIQNPVQPSADGTSLVPYSGTLTIEDELDKLAFNVGIGRMFAGVHWRSDHEHAVRLGELVALRVLQDMTRLYRESFTGFHVRTFGGNTIAITETGPTLPNYVGAIDKLVLINCDTGQPVAGHDPLRNNAVLDLGNLPPRMSIEALSYPGTVGSVRFWYDGDMIQNENSPRYFIGGNSDSNIATFPLSLGPHALTVVPHSSPNGGGLPGLPLTLRFTVQS